MLSIVLFISGGEIFIILLFILLFFGADKIPEFTRMMGKGVREFKKATDDIKREFSDSSSGVLNEIRSIKDDMTGALTKEITEPVKKTMNEAEKTFDEYQDHYNDYYYDNQDYISGNEYRNEAQTAVPENASEKVSETPDSQPVAAETEAAVDPAKPSET